MEQIITKYKNRINELEEIIKTINTSINEYKNKCNSGQLKLNNNYIELYSNLIKYDTEKFILKKVINDLKSIENFKTDSFSDVVIDLSDFKFDREKANKRR